MSSKLDLVRQRQTSCHLSWRRFPDGIFRGSRYIGIDFCTFLVTATAIEEANVAKKTIRVSDISGAEIPDGKGATVRISFHDARKGVRELDVTDAEAEKLGGRQVARRGRRPKATSAG